MFSTTSLPTNCSPKAVKPAKIVFQQTDVMQPLWLEYRNVSYSCLPGPQFSAKWKAHKSFYDFTMNQLQSDGFKPWHHCRVVAAAKKQYNFQHGIALTNQGQKKIMSVVDTNQALTHNFYKLTVHEQFLHPVCSLASILRALHNVGGWLIRLVMMQ